MAADPLPERQGLGRQARDRKPRQTDAGCRWRNLENPGDEDQSLVVTRQAWLPTATSEAGLYPEIEWKAEASRHSDDEGSGDAGAASACPRSGIRDNG